MGTWLRDYHESMGMLISGYENIFEKFLLKHPKKLSIAKLGIVSVSDVLSNDMAFLTETEQKVIRASIAGVIA